jgi:hypothetical protein
MDCDQSSVVDESLRRQRKGDRHWQHFYRSNCWHLVIALPPHSWGSSQQLLTYYYCVLLQKKRDSGPFVPFTIIRDCSTDTHMQTNLSTLVRQTNQSFASVLLASSWIGLSHPHHINSTNARYHVNMAKPSRVRHIEDNSCYTPARSPQFDDAMGS